MMPPRTWIAQAGSAQQAVNPPTRGTLTTPQASFFLDLARGGRPGPDLRSILVRLCRLIARSVCLGCMTCFAADLSTERRTTERNWAGRLGESPHRAAAHNTRMATRFDSVRLLVACDQGPILRIRVMIRWNATRAGVPACVAVGADHIGFSSVAQPCAASLAADKVTTHDCDGGDLRARQGCRTDVTLRGSLRNAGVETVETLGGVAASLRRVQRDSTPRVRAHPTHGRWPRGTPGECYFRRHLAIREVLAISLRAPFPLAL